MILLQPERIAIKIATTDVAVTYSERGGAVIEVGALTVDGYATDRREAFRVVFDVVAELRCISLNFYESNHGEYEVLDAQALEKLEDLDDVEAVWRETGFHPDPGLYQFEDLDEPNRRMNLYDPLRRLGLRSFLLVGNDSYVQVVAQGYRIERA